MASRNEAGSGHQRAEYGDQQVERGAGGETHQVAAGDASRLTTQQGVVVADDQNTLRAGERGPARWRTSISGRRSSTSTTSASPSGWCTPAATARTATSRTTSR